MNIKRQFNWLATGLTLSIAMGCALPVTNMSADSPLVPAGQNPSFLTKIYENFTRSGEKPVASSVFKIQASITTITDIPDNRWLHDLRNMTADKAEQTTQPCLKTLCADQYSSLNETDKFIGNVMVLESMFHNGLNQQEFKTYSEFLAKFEADARFHTHDEEIIEHVVNTILDSAAYENIQTHIVPMDLITPANADQQFHLRRNFMQLVADEMRSAFGFTSIPVYLDLFPKELNTTLAVLIPPGYVQALSDHQAILVNYRKGDADSLEKIIGHLVHEARHGVDFMARDELRNRAFGKEDIRFSHLATIILNDNAVVQPCNAVMPPPSNCSQQYNWYRNQYPERSAYDFSKKFLQKFKQEIKDRGHAPATAPLNTSYRSQRQKLDYIS